MAKAEAIVEELVSKIERGELRQVPRCLYPRADRQRRRHRDFLAERRRLIVVRLNDFLAP